MHMGSLSTVGKLNPRNYYHILINNYAHESVGGQETAAKNIDLSAVVEAMGTYRIFKAESLLELKSKTKR